MKLWQTVFAFSTFEAVCGVQLQSILFYIQPIFRITRYLAQLQISAQASLGLPLDIVLLRYMCMPNVSDAWPLCQWLAKPCMSQQHHPV